MPRKLKLPKPRHDCLELAARAAEMLKAAGFVHVCTSTRSEATYYRIPGRHGVLRIATHPSKGAPYGLPPIYATLTFRGGKRDRDVLHCDDDRFNTMVCLAVVQYFLRSAMAHASCQSAMTLQLGEHQSECRALHLDQRAQDGTVIGGEPVHG